MDGAGYANFLAVAPGGCVTQSETRYTSCPLTATIGPLPDGKVYSYVYGQGTQISYNNGYSKRVAILGDRYYFEMDCYSQGVTPYCQWSAVNEACTEGQKATLQLYDYDEWNNGASWDNQYRFTCVDSPISPQPEETNQADSTNLMLGLGMMGISGFVLFKRK